LRVGGARVSPVHANFIENHDNASALDVVELIDQVRRRVQQETGVILEPEVRLVGFTREELGDLYPYAVSAIN
jgi:UDP-N-acetylmuramate dehydrogenase